MKDHIRIINTITNNEPGVYLEGRSKRQLVDLILKLVKPSIEKIEENEEKSIDFDDISDISEISSDST